MTTRNAYLAVYLGSKTSAKRLAWNALPEGDRRAKEREALTAWNAWMEKHQAVLAFTGGPLGKTKRVSQQGIDDASNAMGAFVVVYATSLEEAAKLFENHPHFSIFPGDAVEVMPVMPVPAG
jgi:YCII-related domain